MTPDILTIEGWSKLKKGRIYKDKVKRIDINRKSKSFHVTIENLDPTQLGRVHEINLPLPIRTGSKACSFISACGIDADTVGMKICLDDVNDAIIGMRFNTDEQGLSQQVDFKRIEKSSKRKTDTSFEESKEEVDQ